MDGERMVISEDKLGQGLVPRSKLSMAEDELLTTEELVSEEEGDAIHVLPADERL